MNRELCDRLPEGSELTLGVEGIQLFQQGFRFLHTLRRRGFKPGEGRVPPCGGRVQRENDFSQIQPFQLRSEIGGPMPMLRGCPEPQTPAGSHAAGTPRALFRRGLANRLDKECVQPPSRVVAGDAGLSAIDHKTHLRKGEGGLSDIGRDNDLGHTIGGEDRVLHLGCLLAVQHMQCVAPGLGQGPQRFKRFADLMGPGHENETVAGKPTPRLPTKTGCGLLPDRGAVVELTGLGESDFDRERSPLRHQSLRGIQKVCQMLRREGGGHDAKAEVGTVHPLDQSGNGQAHIPLKMALVKLVEEDRGNAIEGRVRLQPPKEDALGDKDDPRRLAYPGLMPDLVAHLVAKAGAPFACDPAGQPACGHASGLQDDHLLVRTRQIRDHRGHTGRLTGPGWSGQDKVLSRCPNGSEAGLQGIDGERQKWHSDSTQSRDPGRRNFSFLPAVHREADRFTLPVGFGCPLSRRTYPNYGLCLSLFLAVSQK
jgi:hypothetical protein